MAETAVESVEAFTIAPKVSTGVDGLRWPLLVLAFFVAALIVISRDPTALLRPQFLAEDGAVWFADAYNRGWFIALFHPHVGDYFCTLPRLAAALALLVPLVHAPLVMNLVGLLVQVWPVSLLLSARMSPLGFLPFRSALAAMYLILPNCREVNVTVTEAQWHLAVVACLLVLANPPNSRIQRYMDAVTFLLFGMSGPFCILLLPIAGFLLWRTRDSSRYLSVWILSATSAIQICSMAIAYSDVRFHQPLGATAHSFAGIVGAQIYLGALLGQNTLGGTLGLISLAVIAIVGSGVLLLCLRTGAIEFRLFALFAVLIFAVSLFSPGVPPLPANLTPWRLLSIAPGVRYWFLPTLAFSWSLLYGLAGLRRTVLTQFVAYVLLFGMCFGIVRDFRHESYREPALAQYAAKLAILAKGETITIPENPPALDGVPHWRIRLVKR